MIHWRFGGWNDVGLPRRAEAETWLGAEERTRFEGLTVEKRREDWLVGRVNAKALVADAIGYRYGVRLDPAGIWIDRQPSGAPRVRLGQDAVARGVPAEPPLCISNTHSNGHAMCGLAWLDGYETDAAIASIGVDLEWVEPRSEAFVNDFLTPPERAWARTVPSPERDLRANLVWSAKEAVLKVVQRGLTVDTYWVSCTPAPDPEGDWLVPLLTPVDGEWEPLDVVTDDRFPTHGLWFHVIWREVMGFVATLAVGVRGPAASPRA